MSNYAMISTETNICDNVIVLDEGSQWQPPATHYIVNIDGIETGIGWSYDQATNVWTPPPPPHEPVITPTEASTVV